MSEESKDSKESKEQAEFIPRTKKSEYLLARPR